MSLGGPPAPTPTGFRFRPREAGWALPFLARLAGTLSAFPSGEAVLIEREFGELRALPATSAVADAIRTAADGLPGRLDPAVGFPPPGGGGHGEFVLFVPTTLPPDLAASLTPDARRLRDPLRAAGSASPLGALFPETPGRVGEFGSEGSVQCHWWSTGGPRLAVRVRSFLPRRAGPDPGVVARSGAPVVRTLVDSGYSVAVVTLRSTGRRRRAWERGAVSGLARGPAFLLPTETAARLAAPPVPVRPLDESVLDRHAMVVGASGSGKTSFLAELARRRIERARATVVFDVHGDLGPAIVGGLSDDGHGRVLAIDATRRADAIPGVGLFGSTTADEREREASHLVAGFRHISSEGGETYWGHRLEQAFDVFVRLVEEEDGGFADLYELLTDPNRQEAARLTTHRPVAARFLEQLPALVHRNPEYLQAAIARVQKVALQPKLARLFAPSEPAVPIDRWLAGGGSIIWRIPSSEIGPAASRFAATLLASRVYLSLAARRDRLDGLRVLLVLDEAQAIAPTLLSEILAEGRKFGVGAIVATQYGGRLAPEALGAAIGTAGTHVAFRVPRSGAAASGQWLGLDRDEAERLLPALPTGVALIDAPPPCDARRLVIVPPMPSDGEGPWARAVDRTAADLIPPEAARGPEGPVDDADERILLAVIGSEERGGPTTSSALSESLGGDDGPVPPAAIGSRLPHLVARGWLSEDDGRLVLTPAGARRLGLGSPSGAIREGDLHRALLVLAYRVFARNGERLEIVRQGRFDTRLPDARLTMVPAGLPGRGAAAVAAWADRRRATWVWRAFGGRDVHVEAEVSGAERASRIRRGLDKARRRGAAVVFVVPDARRARRVRAVLTAERIRPADAQVWTLSDRSPGRPRKPDEPPGGSGP